MADLSRRAVGWIEGRRASNGRGQEWCWKWETRRKNLGGGDNELLDAEIRGEIPEMQRALEIKLQNSQTHCCGSAMALVVQGCV